MMKAGEDPPRVEKLSVRVEGLLEYWKPELSEADKEIVAEVEGLDVEVTNLKDRWGRIEKIYGKPVTLEEMINTLGEGLGWRLRCENAEEKLKDYKALYFTGRARNGDLEAQMKLLSPEEWGRIRFSVSEGYIIPSYLLTAFDKFLDFMGVTEDMKAGRIHP